MSQKFALIYRAAANIRVGKQSELSPWVGCCACCAKPIYKPLLCARCNAVLYCSKDCQVYAWKGQNTQPDRQAGFWRQGHKSECAEIKGFMAEMPDVQAVLKQFPWATVGSNGSFDYLLALASWSLLGEGPEFGWWAHPLPEPGMTAKDLYIPGGPPRSDIHGAVLLSAQHLEEEAGWRLPPDQIPWLNFNERKMPTFPPVFEHNWTSYYKWRGLPLESPAALLLHWPLTVYFLLYRLGFVPSKTEIASSKRRKLVIHCIGVEAELNCIPVYAFYHPHPLSPHVFDRSFGELALLFPNTDIDMVMYGASAYKIVHSVKPLTIGARQYVYEFYAPETCGSGSIRIQLYKKSEYWEGNHLSSPEIIPSAMIALNAAMSTFDTWRGVFEASRTFAIPFAITNVNRPRLASDEAKYESWLPMLRMLADLQGILGEEGTRLFRKSTGCQTSAAINPFMRPGNIAAMTNNRIPAAVNGFSCIVTPRLAGSWAQC